MAGEILQYQTEDGVTVSRLQARGGDVWLSQAEIAELFRATVSNINKHIKGMAAEGEQLEATIEDCSIARQESARAINTVSAVEWYFAKAIEGRRPAAPKKGRA